MDTNEPDVAEAAIPERDCAEGQSQHPASSEGLRLVCDTAAFPVLVEMRGLAGWLYE